MSSQPKPKRYLSLALKVGASALIIGYILTTVDVVAVWGVLQSANYALLTAAFLLHGVGIALSAYRWQDLLRTLGYKVPAPFLVNSYLVALFFNQFLPSTIGGDAIRAYDTARYAQAPLPVTLSAVVVDRVVGTFALFLMSVVAFFIGINTFGDDIGIVITLVIMLAIFAGLALLMSRGVAQRLRGLLSLPAIEKVAGKLRSFYTALLMYKQHPAVLGRSLISSLLLQINVVLHYYLISLALHQDVSVLYFFLVIPILIAVLLVAPSINGIGYREAGFVLFLGKAGVSATSAVGLSLTAFAMTVLLGVLGGIIFTLRRDRTELARPQGGEPEPARIN